MPKMMIMEWQVAQCCERECRRPWGAMVVLLCRAQIQIDRSRWRRGPPVLSSTPSIDPTDVLSRLTGRIEGFRFMFRFTDVTA